MHQNPGQIPTLRRVDIFNYDILIFPMHLKPSDPKIPNHWALAIVYFTCGQILYYDSILSPRHEQQYGSLVRSGLENLKLFIEQEHLRKKESSMCTNLRIMMVKKIPEQSNDVDCGVFLLYFATQAMKNNFDMCSASKHISNFREHICRVIR